LVPDADNRIDLALSGPARWVGGENGDPVDITPQRETGRKVFAGLSRGFYMGKTGESGPIYVAALGILGTSYFDDSAAITIAFERIALRGACPGILADIRYTIDGSVPAVSSLRYTGSLVINSTTTVRATVFQEGKPLVSSVATFTKGSRPIIAARSGAKLDMGAAEDPTQVKGKKTKKKDQP